MKPVRFGLIIGAMKCGTTTLFSHLSEHPQVAASRIKEPSFFCGKDYRPDQVDRYRALWNWRSGIHRVALEASANYTKRPAVPSCPERMAAFCRHGVEFRFIYCIRNPLDRIVSHMHHGAHAGWTNSLESGFAAHTLNVSRYATQLEPYVELFGRERVQVVVLEQFHRAPGEWLQRLCEFLEIDSTVPFQDPHRVLNKASEHYIAHPVLRGLRDVAATRRLAKVVPRNLREWVWNATARRLPARRTLTEEERSVILRELRPDLERLHREYGIDPNATWGLNLH